MLKADLKFNRKIWVFLVIGISVCALAGLGVVRLQQIQEKNQLNDELIILEQNLKEYQLEQLSDQQQRSDDTSSQSEAEELILTQPPGSIATSDILFSTADACGVQVIENSSSGAGNGNLEGVTCYVLDMSTTVGGNLSNLINFITMLNRDLTNGIVNTIDINIPEATDGGIPTVNLQMTVYTYQGN